MTDLAELLEDFGRPVEPSGTSAPDLVAPAEVEAREARSYEQGYRAGWDDAVQAQTEDRDRIGSEFAQNLKDLSFTYHEAYSHVLRSMTPLLEEIVRTLLPAALDGALPAHVVSELHARAAECGGLSVEIAVAPEQLAAVQPLLGRDPGFPVELVPDATLSDEQAELRFGEREVRIDLGEISEGLRNAIAGFGPVRSDGRIAQQDNEKERAHG